MAHTATTLHDYLAVLRRRRWLMTITLVVIISTAVVIAFNLPVLYKSTATFLIERPEMKENLATTTITNNFDTDQKIEMVSSRVLTRGKLTNMIEELELFPDRRGAVPLEDLAAEVRENITIETIQSDEDNPRLRWAQTVAFEVSYFSETPIEAQLVAAHLAELFKKENSESRKAQAIKNRDFFREASEGLQVEISALADDIADFKEQYSGSLPELRNLNFQVLERTEHDLENVKKDIRRLEERRNLLSAELSQTPRNETIYEGGVAIPGIDEQLRSLEMELARKSAIYGPEHPDLKRLRREIAILSGDSTTLGRKQVEAQLFAARSALSNALQSYSQDHPDVRRLQRSVQNLETELAAMPRSTVQRQSAPDNPRYIELQYQLDAANVELRAQVTKRAELNLKLDEYEKRLEDTPETENRLSGLVRNYDQKIAEFEETQDKLAKAERAVDLEEGERSERYTLQYPPAVPNKPAKPNKPAIIFLGVLLGLTLAMGGAGLAEAMDSTVRGSKDISAILDMPPLAIIPNFSNKYDNKPSAPQRAVGQN